MLSLASTSLLSVDEMRWIDGLGALWIRLGLGALFATTLQMLFLFYSSSIIEISSLTALILFQLRLKHQYFIVTYMLQIPSVCFCSGKFVPTNLSVPSFQLCVLCISHIFLFRKNCLYLGPLMALPLRRHFRPVLGVPIRGC